MEEREGTHKSGKNNKTGEFHNIICHISEDMCKQ